MASVVLLLLRGFLGFGMAIWGGGSCWGGPVSGILGEGGVCGLRSVAGCLGLASVVGGALRGGGWGYCCFWDFFASVGGIFILVGVMGTGPSFFWGLDTF